MFLMHSKPFLASDNLMLGYKDGFIFKFEAKNIVESTAIDLDSYDFYENSEIF